jgi:hypothetical protein
MPIKQITPQDINRHSKAAAWTAFWAGSATITTTVLYWISQVPPAERAALKAALEAAIALPTK